MSPLPATFSRITLHTVLELLIPLLMTAADGNVTAAFNEALAMLDDYHPATREELFLAGEVISFRLKTLGALRDSEQPDVPRTVVLALMKTANALRRSEAGAQRKLDALQRARHLPDTQEAAAPTAPGAAPPHHPREPAAPPKSPQSPPPGAEPDILTPQGFDAAFKAAQAAVLARAGADPALMEQIRQEGLLPFLTGDFDPDDASPPPLGEDDSRFVAAIAAATQAGSAG